MVSNLDQTGLQSNSAHSGILRAGSFTTGSQATTLQSMVARLSGFDSGGDEFVRIYNDHETLNQPGSGFISFLDNPVDLGTNQQFQFTPSGTNTLSANTTYWMVFGATSSRTGFSPYFTSSFDQTGSADWSIGDIVLGSFDGGNSWSSSGNLAFQFQITAIIPESETYLLASGLMICIFILVRRCKANRAICKIFSD